MSKIVSIATAVPEFKHEQESILTFMQNAYAMNEVDKRKMKFLYHQSGINTRYSVLPDYGLSANDWAFYPATENLEPFPDLELRMKWFNKAASKISLSAIEKCIENKTDKKEITHLITVTCTGLSAPGLDLQIMEALDLPSNIFRTSINFMGCYAAIHALKLADAFCNNDKNAKVLIVCTELCTLHFQKNNSMDNIASSLLFADGSAAASRGLLLYGPPGTGKTMIAKTLAESMGCAFFPLSLPDLKAGYIGQSGEKVKELWQRALAQPRAVIFVDECEGVFSRRGAVNADSFAEEIVQSFLAQWDGFTKQNTVWVVGATNRRDLIDPAILSRFGEEVEIGLPDEQQRLEILSNELTRREMSDALPSEACELTQGMSGREIETLAGRLAREQSGVQITNELLLHYTQAFRKQGSTQTDTSAVWDKLILSETVLKELKNMAGMLTHAEAFIKRGINVPKGLLLYGPPGTGKTQIARTLANETGLRFIAASTADMKAGFVGQSGQKVRELFERAREVAPCLLFLDELDIVAPARGSGGDQFTQEIVGQLLQEMDGVKAHSQHVFVLAASNRLDQIDLAVLSRFPKTVEIPNPDLKARQKLLQVMLHAKPIAFDMEKTTAHLAEHGVGMSGRDLRNWIEQAEQNAVSRAIEAGDPNLTTISLEDFPLMQEAAI